MNLDAHVRMSGGRGIFLIERTSDFADWWPLFNITNLNGAMEFIDPETNSLLRFYRAKPRL